MKDDWRISDRVAQIHKSAILACRSYGKGLPRNSKELTNILRMSFCVSEEEINKGFDRMEAYFRFR